MRLFLLRPALLGAFFGLCLVPLSQVKWPVWQEVLWAIGGCLCLMLVIGLIALAAAEEGWPLAEAESKRGP